MANPAPIISQINAFNATEGTIISFNIVGGTSIVRSNIIYIYDLSDNSLICTHLYISTESIHELPANTDPSIAYASGKSSADFTNGKQYYAQIQTFTNTAGTEGASGASIAKLFWCLVDPTLTINTIPSSISTTSYNVGAVYNSNTTATSNIVQQYQFNLYSATGVLVQSSGVITGSGAQQGTSTVYDLSYNFTGLNVGSSYYITVEATTTQGMTVSAQSNTFTVSIDTPTLGEATVVNNACDGYISVTSNLSGEYGGSASGSIATFETTSVNEISSLIVDINPIQDLHGYDHPWVGGAGKNKLPYPYKSPDGEYGGVNFATDAYGKITANGTLNNSFVFTLTNTLVLTAGTYTISVDGSHVNAQFRVRANGANITTLNPANTQVVFTIAEETTVTVDIVRTSPEINLNTHIQIELGSTATAWTPYSNICPISGWDSVEAVKAGKNLFDKSADFKQWYIGSGAIKTGTVFRSAVIKCKPNTEYVASKTNGSRLLLASFAYYPKVGDRATVVDGTNLGKLISITTGANDKYLVVWFYNGNVDTSIDDVTSDLQVEEGSTATDYEPYQGTTHTATFDETVYGCEYDFIGGSGNVELAKVVFDGSSDEYWSVESYNDGTKCFSRFPDIKADGNKTKPLLTNMFKFRMYSVADYGQITNVYWNTSNLEMTIPQKMTAEEWRAFLQSNPLEVVYYLAEPRTIQLDPQTINTLVGVNNVWADSGDVSVTYNIPITKLLVKRQDTADISGKWLTLYSQPITQASDMDFTFIDFLNQYGKTYKYALVPLLTQEQSGVEVEVEGGYTVSDEVVSIFDGVFVADNTAIYKLKAGVNYGDLSKVQEVGSINTIGSKYPIIVSNSKVDYRTASLSATIVADDYYNNGNLNRMDMVQKRELMESFFTNKRAKILKDWNGNIWLVVFTDNINITFINEYGMGIATLTAAWTEIGDVTNEEDLQNTRIINVG